MNTPTHDASPGAGGDVGASDRRSAGASDRRSGGTGDAAAAVAARPARPEDVATMYGFVRELAAYERAPDAVTGTAEMLGDALFGPSRSAEALIAVDGAGTAVGFAVFHSTFSTWECRPGLWLEDLFVPERFRRAGAGAALLAELAAIALARGCARLEWTALDWNAPALAFYAGLGAERLEEWTTHRLSGEALTSVAARADAQST